MLLSFRVHNYRSLRDEQELSLMRSRRMAGHRSAAHRSEDSVGNVQVSPVAGLYGSNASGKSNVLLALGEMRMAVVHSHSRWAPEDAVPHDPFRLDTESLHMPTRFEAELLLGRVRYQYGFELDSAEILREWLYAYPHGRRQTWFERDATRPDVWYFGKELRGRNRLTADVTRRNSLYLSTAASLKHPKLAALFRWFDRSLRFANADNFPDRLSYTIKKIEDDEILREQVKKLVQFADLGICDLKVELREFSTEMRERILRIARALEEKPDEDKGNSREINLDQTLRDAAITVQFQHLCEDSESPVHLPLESESLGTRALLALAGPVLETLQSGFTLLVDEIDTSLHPRLVAEIIRLFQSAESNPKNAQIIFTSHDTSLLGNLVGDEPVLERDQVWFVEKDRSGASSVYALTDFTPRRLENLERGYLQGRYGAIPFLDRKDLLPALKMSEHDR